MLHYRLLFLMLITCINSYAQNIQGKVVDELTGTGIPFVSIGIMGTNNATVSNENGEFVLKSANFPAKLRYSHVSYFTADQEVTSPSTTLLVKLKPAAINLNMVTVDPYKGLRILKAALEKARVNENLNFYGNAFYRQLTSLNDRPSQIYELFYDLELNAHKVKGWIAKQSRFAELNEKIAFSLNNQSYLTFTFGGYLLPEKTGKFVSLNNLKDFDIAVEKYIEQPNQDIAVISCKYKGSNKKQYYTNLSLIHISEPTRPA
ncbi:carboxypeptidase-like regulatory domain-containing protein [Pedobacter sp. ASV28]|uniref:carboxypeptidase-like regulatory domain-containing protein n=1 Tax=Pedobacter sp. ASV28 TaxID=2795123 RepID=UPI0018EC23E1|nr:carboxypeptidase-like regulatory domain-containing protein [Pedobacter sp. ASV28]